MKKTLVLLAILTSLVCGCTIDKTTVKTDPTILIGNSLYVAQQTLVNIRRQVTVPCKTGVIPKETCKQISDLYEESKPIYDLAVDADLLYLNNQTPTTKTEADAKVAEFIKFVSNASALALKYSIKGDK